MRAVKSVDAVQCARRFTEDGSAVGVVEVRSQTTAATEIRGAELVVLEGAGHGLRFEGPDARRVEIAARLPS
jgi:hypothetical protein